MKVYEVYFFNKYVISFYYFWNKKDAIRQYRKLVEFDRTFSYRIDIFEIEIDINRFERICTNRHKIKSSVSIKDSIKNVL